MLDLNSNFTKIEKAFNIAGSLPGVGVLSGSLRTLIGQIQFLAACIFSGFAMICQLISQCIKRSNTYWEKQAKTGVEHILHGIFNIGRGVLELSISATIFGSCFLIIPQVIRKEGYNPLFQYGKGFTSLSPSF